MPAWHQHYSGQIRRQGGKGILSLLNRHWRILSHLSGFSQIIGTNTSRQWHRRDLEPRAMAAVPQVSGQAFSLNKLADVTCQPCFSFFLNYESISFASPCHQALEMHNEDIQMPCLLSFMLKWGAPKSQSRLQEGKRFVQTEAWLRKWILLFCYLRDQFWLDSVLSR